MIRTLFMASLLLLGGCRPGTEPSGAQPAPVSTNGQALSPALSPAAAATGARFATTLQRQGIRFAIECDNTGSINTVSITPSGLAIDNSPLTREIEGSVTDARVADLDADGSPELYVFVTSAGSGSYGSVVGYAANRRKSLSQIHLAPVTDDPGAARGYMGHDHFELEANRLVRRFPLYGPSDRNATPTGGTRELRYALVSGEAGWILKRDGMVER